VALVILAAVFSLKGFWNT